MTINEIVTAICSVLDGSFMVSKASTSTNGNVSYKDYICVPMGTTDKDGNPQYGKIEVGLFMSKATKVNPAFDPEEGVINFEKHCKAIADKASAPKTSTAKTTEATERTNARKQMVRDWVRTSADTNKAYTATEVYNALPEIGNVMLAGSVCAKLVEEGLFDVSVVEGKKHYTPRKG